MKILISCSTEVYCKGLSGILMDSLNDAEVSCAHDYAGLIEAMRLTPPDLVLAIFPLDGASPDLAIDYIRVTTPHAPLIVMAETHDRSLIASAFDAGALGYLLADCSVSELISTIGKVVDGEVTVAQSIDSPALTPAHRTRSKANVLSPRQTEIGSLIAVGFGNQQIADELQITLGTVKNHVHMLLKRLHATNRTEAAAKLSQMGLLPQGERDYVA